ncbi:RagB/SusD family nutrient uptake outer membrane protein [Spirosoma endbachense]|uniref:RagB/SusD family nutrient uptake outer membrane protein n=1 Tax=Spirosoma endbachense TaxID=2666025 RepID=A0A6P1W6R7_9BACT|nr:RagB/SusD family nutrient uptake outer membrane protein [Spirosoma endbachense]QHW00053.1 RagB/SusD family nutrient uptake outer membrane protein [Spirosoma endbachense]
MITLVKTNKVAAICVGLLLAGSTGCQDILDEKVYSQVAVDAFYKTSDQAQLALNGVYTRLWDDTYRDGQWVTLGDVTAGILIGGGSANGSGDRSGVTNDFNTFSWNSDALELSTAWDFYYAAINRANVLIDKLAGSTISNKARLDGETRFLRALFYFNLVRIFGGVPLQTQGTTDLSEVNKPRNTAEEVYAFIGKDLETAASELSPYSEGDHTAGKATSLAATSLLAKVYLQQRQWQKAADEARKVIDSKAFDLMADYETIVNPDFRNGKEMIFSIQHGGNANSTSQLYQTRMIYLFGPPAMSLSNGTSIQFHFLKDLVIFQARKEFFANSPDTYRKWWSVRDKMPYYYKNGIKDLVRDTVKMYAPFLTKFNRVDFSTGILKEGVDYPLIRYADVLLTYAEAINELGNPTPAAYEAINKVRQRARAVGTANAQPASLYPDLAGLSQAQFRDALLTERAREFVGEGHYRWDLLRHDRLITNAKQLGITAAADKHTLFPIPALQLSRNTALKQNPGYN